MCPKLGPLSLLLSCMLWLYAYWQHGSLNLLSFTVLAYNSTHSLMYRCANKYTSTCNSPCLPLRNTCAVHRSESFVPPNFMFIIWCCLFLLLILGN